MHLSDRPTGTLPGALAVLLAVILASASAQQDGGAANGAADPAKRMGRLIPITLPITGESTGHIRRSVRRALDQANAEGKRPVLVFEFKVPPNQDEFGRGSEFGPSYELADFLSGEQLNQATTVAFIPQSIQGHAVLVALACDEIIMAADAEIGNAGVDSPNITPPIHAAYKEIANRRKTIPAEVALGLVDPALEIWKVETEVSREYVTREGLEELRRRRTVQADEQPLFAAGQPGRLSGREARELDFVSYLAGDRVEVAKALNLPPEDVKEDPSLSGDWRAVRIDIKGPVNSEMINQAQRLIRDAVNTRDVNFVCLWIDSAGGSAVDSVRMATFLADLDPGAVRTVAYIPTEARADAALIALACDQVVMESGAVLGGSGNYAFDDDESAQIRETIREQIAPRKSRSWSLFAAMVDRDLEVFRYTRPGEVGFFTEEELQEQPAPDKWTKGQQITQQGKPFSADAKEAVDYRLADHLVESFSQFKQLYGLQNDPALLEPGWADFLISALASPSIAVFLLIIGFVALYAELQVPGIGLGGFIAVLCFLLFFWSRFLGGTAGWLEVLLFLAGVSFLLLEVFVLPGFGIFGLGGGLLVIASLILASQTFVFPRNDYQFAELQRSLLMIAGVTIGTLVLGILLNRWLPRAPMLGGVMLDPPSDEEAEAISRRESLVDYGEDLVGSVGTTTTRLTPSGKALVGNRLFDVIAEESQMIPRGTQIEVVEVHGNRILVRAVGELT
jgi:membrane-bound ClpP family serine protease